jgi:hypothetical protein
LGLASTLASRRKRLKAAALVDGDNRVVAHRLCIRCGASLRGQIVDEGCPSCAHPIYDSIYGAFLIDSSPLEPKRLRRRSDMVYYPALFLGTLTLIGLIMTAAASRSFVHAVNGLFNVGLFFAMLAPLVALVGLLVFTGRHSIEYYQARYFNAPALIKHGVLLVVVFVALCFAFHYIESFTAAVLRVAFGTLPVALFLQRLGRLMGRVPSRKLSSASQLAAVIAVLLGIAALGVLLLRRAAPGNRELEGFLVTLTFMTTLGGIGLGCFILRLLYLARRTLRAVAC